MIFIKLLSTEDLGHPHEYGFLKNKICCNIHNCLIVNKNLIININII